MLTNRQLLQGGLGVTGFVSVSLATGNLNA